jgi:hypothetical protein
MYYRKFDIISNSICQRLINKLQLQGLTSWAITNYTSVNFDFFIAISLMLILRILPGIFYYGMVLFCGERSKEPLPLI